MNDRLKSDPDKDENLFAVSRARMVESQLRARGIRDPLVLEAFADVPRHRFVRSPNLEEAYADYPLPIGEAQTISQPYIVALMLQELMIKKGEKTLEIGTGSGYQTALLAEMGCNVYTIERFASLQNRAKAALDELGYTEINYKVGDGTLGWAEEAPFDCITIGAAAPKTPPTLIGQLSDKGRMILPIGGPGRQELTMIEKIDGRIRERVICSCVFVQLIGREGWSGE